MKTKIKTIDVNGKEWFDKVNGNSYFAGVVIVNYGMQSEKVLYMPFQYGYGSQYTYEAGYTLHRNKIIDITLPLWQYCNNNKIIYRHSLIENCKKRDLMYYNK